MQLDVSHFFFFFLILLSTHSNIFVFFPFFLKDQLCITQKQTPDRHKCMHRQRSGSAPQIVGHVCLPSVLQRGTTGTDKTSRRLALEVKSATTPPALIGLAEKLAGRPRRDAFLPRFLTFFFFFFHVHNLFFSQSFSTETTNCY